MRDLDLRADGTTNLGEAIQVAIKVMKKRIAEWKAIGIQYRKPILMLLTDGYATDDIGTAIKVLQENRKKFGNLWAFGIEDADFNKLLEITSKTFMLDDDAIGSVFTWINQSLATISYSHNDDVILPNLPSDIRIFDEEW